MTKTEIATNTEIAKVSKEPGKIAKITPIPELKEAFQIFACGFKLGAIYGINLPKAQKNHKKLIAFLESEEAQTMIYGILLEETKNL